jgi:two-component system, OmpR family, phosphate regulon sensor histidine kinase PhoR
VAINLVHNAIKFTPAGGFVTVTARAVHDAVVVSVADTGAGIPAEDLSRIFERFYKADRARAGGGTGLGLAIAKHTIQAHNGRLWVESVEGKGSTFSFTLPLVNLPITQS